MVASSSRSNSKDNTSNGLSYASSIGLSNSFLIVPFPSHFTELISHPDFALLGNRFSSNIWSERFEFTLEISRYSRLISPELRESLIVAICKELVLLHDIDSDGAISYISRDKVFGRLIIDLRALNLLLSQGLVDEAIKLRSILRKSGITRAPLSDTIDPDLVAILNREPQRFFEVFDRVDADSLSALLESGTDGDVLVQVLLGNNAKDSKNVGFIYNALIKICCTVPDLSNYADQLVKIFHSILDFIPESHERHRTLVSAFKLRGLVQPKQRISSYPPELIEAAFLGGSFYAVADLLTENRHIQSKVIEFINRNPAFETFLIRNPSYFSRLITDRNVFACQSRNIFVAFYKVYPTFLDILKDQSFEMVRSMIKFVAPQGNFEEISVLFPRLACLADKWSFFARFVEHNESDDFVTSLKFLLQKCTFSGLDQGRVSAELSPQNYEMIRRQAPELLNLLTLAPYGVVITNLSALKN